MDMAFGRKIGLQGLTYRGGGPMLAWSLHRISGIAIVFFVGLHVIAAFGTQQLGSGWSTTVNIIYESWFFQIFVYFFVIFHTLNGFRIVLLDIWPRFLKFQREATWLQWLIFISLYGLAVYTIIQRMISGE
jgi:succinate dehydrogenase / fumarate reductase cytochrome b subunit